MLSEIMVKLENSRKTNLNYSNVQEAMEENSEMNDSILATQFIDGYKYCSFEVSKDRVANKIKKLDDNVILEAIIPFDEKVRLVFKDSPFLIKTIFELKENKARFHTDNKLADAEKLKLLGQMHNNLNCALSLLTEDKNKSLAILFGLLDDELKRNKNFSENKSVEDIFFKDAQKINEGGDPKKCSFEVPESEWGRIKEIRKKSDEQFEAAWKTYEENYTFAHPNLKKIIENIEPSIKLNNPISEKARKKITLDSVNLLFQTMDQTSRYPLSMIVSKFECNQKLVEVAQKCSQDKEYRLILKFEFLFKAFCSKNHKDEFPVGCFNSDM